MNAAPTTPPAFPMHRPTVYLDSTIPSYLVTQRQDALSQSWHRITVIWWERVRPHFECFISQVVIEEVEGGKTANAQKRLETLRGIPFVVATTRVIEVAQYYIDQKAMPSRDTRDALHLAMATVHGIDYLLTWNFRHLANDAKKPHLDRLNKKLGLKTPTIDPPLKLMHWRP
jgi:predicted nucleic acid-binding protein